MSVIVDSGVIIAAFNRRDRYHGWAKRTLAKLLGGVYGTVFVTDYIVDEVLSYAAKKLGSQAGLKLGKLFFEKRVFRVIPVTLDILWEAWTVYRDNLPKLSFTDATTLVAARVYGVDYIATVDTELSKLYASITPWASPRDA